MSRFAALKVRAKACVLSNMLRVLIATLCLTGRTGTEIVTMETAEGLRRRGHRVTIYTTLDGASGEVLRNAGFEVITDLAELDAAPQLIQANQSHPLLEALAMFPDVPALSICHDAAIWYSEPVHHPLIRQAAVDLACRERIEARIAGGVGHDVLILPNAVDLRRFARRSSLPARPRRALVIAKARLPLAPIEAACALGDIELDVIGPDAAIVADDLPARFAGYDIVLSSARSILEALAVGCCGIVVDGRGFAGLVTSDTMREWRANNFGSRILTQAITAESVSQAIRCYCAQDAARVTDFVREDACLEVYLDRLESVYAEMLQEPRLALSRAASRHWVAKAYRDLLELQYERRNAQVQAMTVEHAHRLHTTEVEHARHMHVVQMEHARQMQHQEAMLRAETERALAAATAHEAALGAYIAAVHRSTSWRISAPLRFARQCLDALPRRFRPRN
jgi:hypothetical protein